MLRKNKGKKKLKTLVLFSFANKSISKNVQFESRHPISSDFEKLYCTKIRFQGSGFTKR